MLKEKFISFKLSTTPLRNAFHSLRYRETLAKFYFPFDFPSFSRRKSTRSFICRVSTSRSSNLGWNSRPRRMREALQGSAPLFSLLSFFLAVFFLTFWNRHGAERGSLTKVGNHTHRFHAIPVRSTRLQGGRVGRASSARVFLPTMQPRKDSRRSSF